MKTSLQTKVELALEALVSLDDLNADEQELYVKKLFDGYREPSPVEDEFFADLRARGGAVGMDETGNIVVDDAQRWTT